MTINQAISSAGVLLPACVVCLSATVRAAPQQPSADLPVSLERIRQGLEEGRAPRLNLQMPLQVPVATFRVTVKQRVYVPTLEEHLRKEFALTALQRQSAEWGAKCCGLDLSLVFKPMERALERRKVRKIREQIARELAALEAARKKQASEGR